MNEIYGGDGSHVHYQEGRVLRGELRSLLEKEEIYWRQRSRVAWLREGDRNTRYFHSCASQRKKTNTIVGVRDAHNVWQREETEIANVVDYYFHGIYTTTHPPAIDEVIREVDQAVSLDMN